MSRRIFLSLIKSRLWEVFALPKAAHILLRSLRYDLFWLTVIKSTEETPYLLIAVRSESFEIPFLRQFAKALRTIESRFFSLSLLI